MSTQDKDDGLTDSDLTDLEEYVIGKSVGYLEQWIRRLSRELAALKVERDNVSADLLRVRTAAHGAAHALDNLAVEFGWGLNLTPMQIADKVRQMKTEHKAFCNTLER